jgi:hypothetical protein
VPKTAPGAVYNLARQLESTTERNFIMKTKRSESIANLAAALAVAQGQIKTAAKDAKADTGKFSYSYATLDAIWEVARKPLSENGLSVIQIPTNDDGAFYLETILAHSSGEWISGTMMLPISSGRMSELQAMGSAITYARRYMLGAMVGVTTGDDDDGQRASNVSRNDEQPKPVSPTMNVGKLLKRLNREDDIKGFYKQTSDIKNVMSAGREWPASDDIEGWKTLFNDARVYALERIIQNGETSPDMTDDIETQHPEIFGEN